MQIPANLIPFSHTAVANGVQLHYYDTGDPVASDSGKQNSSLQQRYPGLPLVLLHGNGDEADTWRGVIEPLARTYRVLAPDLPGFGRSGPLAGRFTSARVAQTLWLWLGGLGIEQVILVGHSLGGLIAARMALLRPERVAHLIIEGGMIPGLSAKVSEKQEATNQIEVKRGGTAPFNPQLLVFLLPILGEQTYNSFGRSQQVAYESLRPYYANLDALPEADRTFLRERVWQRVHSKTQRAAFLSALRWLVWDSFFQADRDARQLSRLTMPISLIWGEQDRIVPAGNGQAIAQTGILPRTHFSLISGAGHQAHQERPGEFLAVLNAELSGA